MVQANQTYKVLRTLPRRGERYAVLNRRTGVTEIRTATRDFNRDKRRVFVLQGDDAA